MGSTTYEWLLRHEDMLNHPEKWPLRRSPCGRPDALATCPPIPDARLRFHSGAVAEIWPELRDAAGDKDVWVVGGGDLVGQFADAGLLDEVRVSIAPVTLGSGRPLLPRRLESDRLRLESVRQAGQFAELVYSVTAPRTAEHGRRVTRVTARSSSRPRTSARGCRRTTCRSADGAPTGRRARDSRRVVATRGLSGRAGSDHQDGCGLEAERREHTRRDAVMAAGVHVQAVVRPVPGRRQLTVGPIERAHDVGPLRQVRGDAPPRARRPAAGRRGRAAAAEKGSRPTAG